MLGGTLALIGVVNLPERPESALEVESESEPVQIKASPAPINATKVRPDIIPPTPNTAKKKVPELGPCDFDIPDGVFLGEEDYCAPEFGEETLTYEEWYAEWSIGPSN